MDDDSGNKTDTTPDNQTRHSVQAPFKPPIAQPGQTVAENLSSFEQVSTNSQADTVNQSVDKMPKSNNKFVLLLLSLLCILVLATIGVFVSKKLTQSNDQQASKQSTLTVSPTEVQEQSGLETVKFDVGCEEFSDKLEACTEYSCQFTHPITGEQMTRVIRGLNSSICSYSEQMPNNGKMDCEYTEEVRIAVAQYHRDFANSESFGFELSAELNPDGWDADTKHTINGNVVSNPLQEALDTGQCVVSGY